MLLCIDETIKNPLSLGVRVQLLEGSGEGSLWACAQQEGNVNAAADLAQWFPASLAPWQAASARATSSPHGGPGEHRGASAGDPGIQIPIEVNSISVDA